MVLQVYGNAPSRESTAVVLMAILDHQLKLLIVYENSVTYQPKFDFFGIGEVIKVT
jgi:hypothetical protein